MKSAIIIFPGTNRDSDMVMALEKISGTPPKKVWYNEGDLPAADLFVLAGGFAYGDYLRAGAMAARAPVIRALADRAAKGAAVLGVCNGFQILTEIGLLPGALMRNTKLKFICRNLDVRVEETDSIFTKKYQPGQKLSFPVAHNDGNYFADKATIDQLEEQNRIAFRYVNTSGQIEPDGNPNGSVRNIAGILNKKKNVLGLMPHPENATDPELGGSDGQGLFQSVVEHLS
ncbi:MAG: phosphoribosylformylglycinamidine synthase I [Rhodospirillaceae bacterium]|nr:phosphoribosylformylglycinamidine synthase I [Rhodospirillaceae bacterium]